MEAQVPRAGASGRHDAPGHGLTTDAANAPHGTTERKAMIGCPCRQDTRQGVRQDAPERHSAADLAPLGPSTTEAHAPSALAAIGLCQYAPASFAPRWRFNKLGGESDRRDGSR